MQTIFACKELEIVKVNKKLMEIDFNKRCHFLIDASDWLIDVIEPRKVNREDKLVAELMLYFLKISDKKGDYTCKSL